MSRNLKILLVLLVGAIIWFIPIPAGVKPQAWKLLALFAATIVGFILQPMPMGVIAFTSLVCAVFLKILTLPQALSGFANGTIWLIVSAFLFAAGFVKTGLGRRIAYMLINAIGGSSMRLAYALILSDLIIAPATPSNTARGGGILYPIIRSLAATFNSEPNDPSSRKIGAYLIQTTYQSLTVTSAMFITAVSSNVLAASLATQLLKIPISWGTWALAAIVPGLISLALIPIIMYKLYPPEIQDTSEARTLAASELKIMGKMSRDEKIVAFVFIMALVLWATSQWTKLDATLVAMLGVAIMLWSNALTWKDVLSETSAWDTMVWMGTLVALAGALNSLGLIAWFAKTVSVMMVGIHWTTTVFTLALIYIYTHYMFASTTAHVTAMYAAFLAVAVAAGAPPVFAALVIVFATTLCSSLTHYAMGPSPILFGAGYVPQNTWWRLGFIFSLVYIVIWYGIGLLWWKVIGIW